jgi:hypothetical protein
MNIKEVEENNKAKRLSKIRRKVKKNKELKGNNRNWTGREGKFELLRFKDNWLNQGYAEVEWLP